MKHNFLLSFALQSNIMPIFKTDFSLAIAGAIAICTLQERCFPIWLSIGANGCSKAATVNKTLGVWFKWICYFFCSLSLIFCCLNFNALQLEQLNRPKWYYSVTMHNANQQLEIVCHNGKKMHFLCWTRNTTACASIVHLSLSRAFWFHSKQLNKKKNKGDMTSGAGKCKRKMVCVQFGHIWIVGWKCKFSLKKIAAMGGMRDDTPGKMCHQQMLEKYNCWSVNTYKYP